MDKENLNSTRRGVCGIIRVPQEMSMKVRTISDKIIHLIVDGIVLARGIMVNTEDATMIRVPMLERENVGHCMAHAVPENVLADVI